jgi:hypothetical protein
LKDPLLPKQTLFASADDLAFFRSKTAATVVPQPKEILKKPLPLPPTPKPVAPVHKKEKEAPPAQEISAPKPAAKTHEPIKTEGFELIKKTLVRVVPHVQLVDAVPDDAHAKKIAGGWKEKIPDAEVILLACDTDSETLELLKSLGKAIDQNLAKAKIIPAEKLEQENRWEMFLRKNQFRLIVASEGMKKLPELMKFYTAIPSQAQSFLDKTPLLALSTASVYKAIEQKAHLWKTLCQLLKNDRTDNC